MCTLVISGKGTLAFYLTSKMLLLRHTCSLWLLALSNSGRPVMEVALYYAGILGASFTACDITLKVSCFTLGTTIHIHTQYDPLCQDVRVCCVSIWDQRNGMVYAHSTSKEIAEDQSSVHIMAMQWKSALLWYMYMYVYMFRQGLVYKIINCCFFRMGKIRHAFGALVISSM